MINKETDTRADTHMKWRDFGSESPSGLYCMNRYKSPDHPMGSIFKSPVYYEHKSKSLVTEFGSHEWVWIAVTCNQTLTNILIHTYTYTYTCSCIRPRIHTYTVYTYIHSQHTHHVYPCVHMQKNSRTYPLLHTSMHPHNTSN